MSSLYQKFKALLTEKERGELDRSESECWGGMQKGGDGNSPDTAELVTVQRPVENLQ